MEALQIKALIEDGLEETEARIMTDDNTHYAAVVISPAFAGKRPLARHQLVYGCLGTLMGNEIHAMSIQAHTPEEWASIMDRMDE